MVPVKYWDYGIVIANMIQRYSNLLVRSFELEETQIISDKNINPIAKRIAL